MRKNEKAGLVEKFNVRLTQQRNKMAREKEKTYYGINCFSILHQYQSEMTIRGFYGFSV
jgi:hypothetical protein